MVLTAYPRALLGVPGLIASVPPGSRRVGHKADIAMTRGLISASGDQDHTTSPSALVALVLRATCVHRIPLPTSVTIAKRPSCGAGCRPYTLSFISVKAKYF